MTKEQKEVEVTRTALIDVQGMNFEEVFTAALAAGVPVKEASVNYHDMPDFLVFEWEDVVSIG